jgi:DNA-directed RNA polymerase subunit K/omega
MAYMTETPDLPDATDPESQPLTPSEPAPPIHSRFLFVDVAALRAKQLRRGARVRFDVDPPAPHKLERVAMEEVRRGLVYYEVPVKFPPETEGQA